MMSTVTKYLALTLIGAVLTASNSLMAGDFVGWDANGNPIVSSPDGNGGQVIPGGNGGFRPLIPVDGGYIHGNDEGGFDFKPASPSE